MNVIFVLCVRCFVSCCSGRISLGWFALVLRHSDLAGAAKPELPDSFLQPRAPPGGVPGPGKKILEGRPPPGAPTKSPLILTPPGGGANLIRLY